MLITLTFLDYYFHLYDNIAKIQAQQHVIATLRERKERESYTLTLSTTVEKEPSRHRKVTEFPAFSSKSVSPRGVSFSPILYTACNTHYSHSIHHNTSAK